MKRANAVLFSLLMIVSSLAGCIGGEDFDSSDLEQQIADLKENQELMNQTIIAQQNENDELRASMEMMNQTLNNQALVNVEIQQAMEDMNASNAEDVQNLLSSIVGIQINISANKGVISSLIEELENLNSSDSDLLAQLNATQNYLDSLESDLNTTIAGLISEIDWANDTANWANKTLRLPFMNLQYGMFDMANLVGADLRNTTLDDAYFRYANLSYANLSGATAESAYFEAANLRFADLSYTELINVDLQDANLANANLHGAILVWTDLTNVYWDNTICPDGTNSDGNGNTCVNNL